nr:DUF305 domain-containing protein [Euryhalocaulis caribicus]
MDQSVWQPTKPNGGPMNKYIKFAAMILTATLVMFGLKYLNTYEIGHVFFSETRFYMAFMMGAAMAIIMLVFMLDMYKDKKINMAIVAGSVVLFGLTLWLVRSQQTIEDEAWMKAMIPHHSIAILTSERANISDVRVRELANEIILAQRREIEEMKFLLEDIENNGEAATEDEAAARPVPEFSVSLNPEE